MLTCSREPIDKIRLPALPLLEAPLRVSAGDHRAKGLRPPPGTTLRNNEAEHLMAHLLTRIPLIGSMDDRAQRKCYIYCIQY